MENNNQVAVFAGGCFWCTEAVFQSLKGIKSVVSGYTGGSVKNPSYEQVSSGTTGHAEAIKIEFDPTQISFTDLLEVFFATHDPTTLNRQGNDIGTQYRSAFFYASPEQKMRAEEFISKVESDKIYSSSVVTTLEPLGDFFEAEEYHKNYFLNNQAKPYCQVVINPKLEKFKMKFSSLLKK